MTTAAPSKPIRLLLTALLLAVVAGAASWGWSRYWVGRGEPLKRTAEHSDGDGHDHDHAGHDHGHPGHDESNSLELSAQARSNIGLTLVTVKLEPFEKTISIPGMIVERPGRTTINVTAPMTGVVTKIDATQGEAVRAGQPLCEMRLTHEELVQAQGDLLKTAESLDVTRREFERIEKLAKSGSIAGKALIDLDYEKQKAEAVLRAQSQTLVLHGLTQAQVDEILKTRHLLAKLSVAAPAVADHAAGEGDGPLLQVQQLRAELGQHVNAGDVLFVLADQRELFIEGRAFAQDVDAVTRAAAEDWKVSAVVESKSLRPEDVVGGLQLEYLANKVDPESRAFRFYVALPNRVLREKTADDGKRYVDWEFKPGQRVQVRVPVEKWADRIVLPVAAVASEGSESFVFQANGDHFDRRPVHVEYRDQVWAVIANDGSIFPGDVVAGSAAFQLQTALKNKSAGAIDPHAGHNH